VGVVRVRPLRNLLGILVLVAMASACGARLDDSQLAAAQRQQGGGQTAGGAASGTPTQDTLAAGESPTTTAAVTGGGAGAAQATTPGSAPAATGGPCTPKGGGEKGVTPTEITIGNVSTISGPVPGLGETAQAGLKAYVNYVNSKGGVCGRKVKVQLSDDRLDTGTNRAETQRMANQVLGFAGSWSVVDDGGASVLTGTNIPDVSLALSDQRIAMANNFSPNPIDPTSPGSGITNILKYFHGSLGVTKAAIVWPAQAAARKRAQAFKFDMQAAGIEVVNTSEVAITQTDYTGVATQIKNAGADLVITALEVGGMAKLAQAFKQQGYTPKVPFYGAQSYSKKFIQQAGAAAEGTTIGIAFDIAEDAPQNPSMAAFQQWYARTNPGADPDFFAILSWASAAMFLQAVEQAGPTPTRDLVMAKLKAMTDTDAGGVLAPHVNPAGKKGSPCFMVAKVQGGEWVRSFPAKGFQCG
jgi:ABC-type branched-subunit amino acid transport system substrate-binding protein